MGLNKHPLEEAILVTIAPVLDCIDIRIAGVASGICIKEGFNSYSGDQFRLGFPLRVRKRSPVGVLRRLSLITPLPLFAVVASEARP